MKVILVALLSGPITWAHYLTWAIIPIMLLADPERLAGLRSPLVRRARSAGPANGLMTRRRWYYARAGAAHWYYRPYSAAGTVAALACLAVALYFLGTDTTDRGAGSGDPLPIATAATGGGEKIS